MIRLKDYLSWSQYSLWKTSKKQYYRKYSIGEDSFSNKFFEKGKELGEYLKALNENPDVKRLAESMSSDPLLEQIGRIVPTLDIMEDELNVELENGQKLKAFVDSVDMTNSFFLEYKTGKVDPKGNDAWTQEKVDAHGQLAFYALSYYIKSGRTEIPSCKLIWIETIEVEVEDLVGTISHTKLVYTGRVEEFERSFIVSELIELEKDIISVIEEIEEYEYVEVDVQDSIVNRYIYLKNMIEECTEEMNVIKEGLLAEMDLDDVKYASSASGKFTVSERKTWSYTDTLEATMKESKTFFDKAKKLEQKDGSATSSIKKSLLFKEI